MDTKKISTVWLVTGKKLDTTRGVLVTDKGLIVRSGDMTTLMIPLGVIVAVECLHETKEKVDQMFNG